MTIARRSFIALSLAIGLTACGFTPLYAPGEAGDRLRGQLTPTEPPDRRSFDFAAQIETRLGRVADGQFRLTYQIGVTFEDQAITDEQEIQRIAVLGTVDYTVVEAATGRTLTSGRLTGFTGYNTTDTTIAAATAAADAEQRLMVILADNVVAELTATGESWLP